MRTAFDSSVCRNLKTALATEWLETNGLGGYASSTIIGANTRGQHGLLVVASQTPLHRHVLFSKFEERVLVNGHESYLCTNLYPGTVFPHGFNIQTEFRAQPWPTFRYGEADFEIEKNICMVRGENTVVVAYRNLNSRGPLELRLRPLLAYRDHNALRQRNENVNLGVERDGATLVVRPREALPRLFFNAECDDVEIKPDWYYRFTYPEDQARGRAFEEDLFTAFELVLKIPAGEVRHVIVSTENHAGVRGADLIEAETKRRHSPAGQDAVRQALCAAAAAFLVRRASRQSVLAGYPWYTDSGRVAMVALPGLTLARGDLVGAQQVLEEFAQYCERGLMPNRFDELTGRPEYSAADAALWFVVAAWRWWRAKGDAAAAAALLPVIREIVTAYRDGTRFGIGADTDGLIVAGGPGSQLTWMDVKIEGYVPTPRDGKPVEVNALWYNTLLMLAEMEQALAKDANAAGNLRQEAERVGASFVKAFWNDRGGCLFDVVRGGQGDDSIRPNQILAVGLPFSPLSREQQKAVFDVVTAHLLTPYGLRTLSPRNERYCRHYAGNRRQRDSARHQGTAWPWLIGAYADAYARVHGAGKTQRKEILALLQPLLEHLDHAGAGSISELFDGDPPHREGGCIASAWAVGEVFRIYDTYAK